MFSRQKLVLCFLIFSTMIFLSKINADSDVKKENLTTIEINGVNLLFDAILNCDAYKVRRLVERGLDINIKNDDNWSPLHFAAEKGDMKIVKMLIKMGANINDRNDCLYTPLLISISNNKENVAKFLIENGADVNVVSDCKDMALHLATKNNLLDIVKLIVAKGADINAMGCMKVTPLLSAIMCGNVEIVDFLLDCGAVIDVFRAEASPLLSAISSGNLYLVEKFIKNKEFINRKWFSMFSPISVVINNILCNLFYYDFAREDTFFNDLKILELLLENKADIKTSVLSADEFQKQDQYLREIIKMNLNDLVWSTVDVQNISKEKVCIFSNDLGFNKFLELDTCFDDLGNQYFIYNEEDILDGTLKTILSDTVNCLDVVEIDTISDDYDDDMVVYNIDSENPFISSEVINEFKSIDIVSTPIGKRLIAYNGEDINNRSFLGLSLISYILFEAKKVLLQEDWDCFFNVSLLVDFLLKHGARSDIKGYSPYELIKNNYDKFVKIINLKDAPKDLPNLRKLLKEIHKDLKKN